MMFTKENRIEAAIEDVAGQANLPKLNLDKVMVRNLVQVKSSIRAGAHDSCGSSSSSDTF